MTTKQATANKPYNLDDILNSTAADKFQAFRKAKIDFRYARFAYRIVDSSEHIKIEALYDFRLEPLFNFCPSFSLEIPKNDQALLRLQDRVNLEKLIFQIGLMESLSYWKACCPATYILEIANLPQLAKDTWHNWYFNGLGEMLYRNNISTKESELVQFVNKTEAKLAASTFIGTTVSQLKNLQQSELSFAARLDSSYKVVEELQSFSLEAEQPEQTIAELSKQPVDSFRKPKNHQPAVLIPVGGGKDSVVSLELLKSSFLTRYSMTINGSQASLDCLDIAEIEPQHRIVIKRNLDRRIVNLNQLGFLNGHTPFSGIVAFYSYLVAYLLDIPYIALSNEASSNSATVKGSNINHQYSKTSLFEQSFQAYSQTYLGNFAYYFSFLRNLNELAIAKLFSNYKAYYPVFRSCNLGSKAKANLWCANCAKCLFVYIALSLYIQEKELVNIFQSDIFANSNLEADLAALLGVSEVKPFECVGTVSEVSYVIAKLLNARKAQSYLLKQAENWIKANKCPYIKYQGQQYNYIGLDPLALQKAPLIPEQFRRIIQEKTNETLGK